MAKRKSAYRDYPPSYPGSPKPPYGYNPYTTEAWKAYASPMMNYTILALDESTNQWRHITNYAQGKNRQDAVERYYRNTSIVPTQLMVFPSESGRRMKQPAPKPQWEEVHLA
jgi:hypothetical protein